MRKNERRKKNNVASQNGDEVKKFEMVVLSSVVLVQGLAHRNDLDYVVSKESTNSSKPELLAKLPVLN